MHVRNRCFASGANIRHSYKGANGTSVGDDNYYAFVRQTAEEKLLIVFNNSQTALDVTIPSEGTALETARQLENLFGPGNTILKNNALTIALPPTSLAVYSVR